MATRKTEEKKTEKKTAVGKTAAKGAAEVKNAVSAAKEAVKKTAAKKPAAKKAAEVIIQSPVGGEITPEAILAKVGKADKIYVRVDENKAYWVRGTEAGSVDLWD